MLYEYLLNDDTYNEIIQSYKAGTISSSKVVYEGKEVYGVYYLDQSYIRFESDSKSVLNYIGIVS